MIYIFKVNEHNHYKIGRANNVINRLKTIDKMNSFGVSVVKTYNCKHDSSLERKIHHYLKDKKIKGEWFQLNESDIDKLNIFIKNNDKDMDDRDYIVVKVNKESNLYELGKKCSELFNHYRIGQGKRTDLKKGERYRSTGDIVSEILNVNIRQIYKLKKLYEYNPEVLKDIDNGKYSSVHNAYSVIFM